MKLQTKNEARQPSRDDPAHGAARLAAEFRRRTQLYKRSGVLGCASPQFEIRQANSASELREAYQLVHDTFCERGYITPHASGMRLRIYEALPETATFIAKADGRVVAVLSIVPDSSKLGLPSDQAFADELGALRAANRRVGEVTNLAIHPDYRKSSALFELAQYIFAHALIAGLDDLFVTISPSHATFFQMFMCFEHWGHQRDRGAEVVDIVQGMRLELAASLQRARAADRLLGDAAFIHRWFFSENPRFENRADEEAEARARFLRPDTLQELFSNTGFLAQCPTSHKTELYRRWGAALYLKIASEALNIAPAA